MHLKVLPATHRFVMQVLSILGRTTRSARVLPEVSDTDSLVTTLAVAGFIRIDGEAVQLAHRLLARLALTISTPGSLAEVHRRIAASLAGRPDQLELRAFHAIRAEGDDVAFFCSRARPKFASHAATLAVL